MNKIYNSYRKVALGHMSSDIVQFETGAKRSGDADKYAFHLIHPGALREMIYFVTNLPVPIPDQSKELIPYAVGSLYTYMGATNIEAERYHLEYACLCLMLHFEEQEFVFKRKEGIQALPPEGLRALAATYKEGSLNYPLYNCEKGFPIGDLINHAILHIIKYFEGDFSEPQIEHALWNVFMCIVMRDRIDINHLLRPTHPLGKKENEVQFSSDRTKQPINQSESKERNSSPSSFKVEDSI